MSATTNEQEKQAQSRKPSDDAFRQQRLPAWQPVLIPRTVLPTLFIVGILFTPVGGLLYWCSGSVDEILINYSYCGQYDRPVYLAPTLYNYQTAENINITEQQPPAYHYENHTTFVDPTWSNPNNLTIKRCILDFTVPRTMQGPVFMYYRLTNFYQNHRQYIKNFDADQLSGKAVALTTSSSSCAPLAATDAGSIVYPCGLIANSMFNAKLKTLPPDTASNFTSVNAPTHLTYNFSRTGIAWPTDRKKYGRTQYPLSQIVPPPNWALRYPNGRYDEQHPPPDLSTMERFMVWMHVAALPDFRKIWGRNDNDDLVAGRWRLSIDMSKDRGTLLDKSRILTFMSRL
ncbi:hypothetical protein DFQ28_006339 [Apophysomyces sp. BC1034]|nr:hypothetical protein DFQ28_006339 [Apophysomyces sp. BC1034]